MFKFILLFLILSVPSFAAVTDNASLIFPVAKVLQVRNDYSSVNVTTAAYVQLVASLGFTATSVEIFDSSGRTLQIGVGAAASEIVQFYVFPGGNGHIDIRIPKGSRVAIKAVSGNATSGEIDINFYTNFYQVK